MDKNTERLVEIAKRRSEIEAEIAKATESATLETLEQEVRSLNEETLQIRKSTVEKINEEGKEIKMEKEIIKTNNLETTEYRNAFRDYVLGKSKDVLNMRADAVTATTDVGAVIPTTIMNFVVQQLKDYGEILPLVTMTNIKGGVAVPVAGTKPTATWVSEGSVADKQKQQILGSVIFSYHKLQVRVANTLLSEVVTLELWEKTVAENIAEAMAVALESAVLLGSGVGQPLGILNDLDEGAGEGIVPVANQIEFGASDATYEGWLAKLISSIPLAYRKKRNGVVFMSHLTWDKYVWGLVDEYGQPVARVNFGMNGEEQLRLFGKTVILTELLPSLDSATEGDAVVLYADLSDYFLNSNMQMTLRQYFDENTDEFIRKATLIVDGKLTDGFGVVVLKKA